MSKKTSVKFAARQKSRRVEARQQSRRVEARQLLSGWEFFNNMVNPFANLVYVHFYRLNHHDGNKKVFMHGL